MKDHEKLRKLSETLTGVALIPPLVASFPIGAVLGVVSNRAQESVMVAAGICWLPIGGPALLASKLIDKYIGDDKNNKKRL